MNNGFIELNLGTFLYYIDEIIRNRNLVYLLRGEGCWFYLVRGWTMPLYLGGKIMEWCVACCAYSNFLVHVSFLLSFPTSEFLAVQSAIFLVWKCFVQLIVACENEEHHISTWNYKKYTFLLLLQKNEHFQVHKYTWPFGCVKCDIDNHAIVIFCKSLIWALSSTSKETICHFSFLVKLISSITFSFDLWILCQYTIAMPLYFCLNFYMFFLK